MRYFSMLWKAICGRFDRFTDNDWFRFYRALLFIPLVIIAVIGFYAAWQQ